MVLMRDAWGGRSLDSGSGAGCPRGMTVAAARATVLTVLGAGDPLTACKASRGMTGKSEYDFVSFNMSSL
ncbi:MAG: hypothetical protein NC218_06635 [Acetobacter sp.]|nr:hypothetical protein [Acetobacter sp.]